MSTITLTQPRSLRGVSSGRLARELAGRLARRLSLLAALLTLRPYAAVPRPLRVLGLASLPVLLLGVAIAARNGALAAAVGPCTALAVLVEASVRRVG